MADLRDEFGNPIQLNDQHGNPVHLTNEFGNPMHLSGIAKQGGSGVIGSDQPQMQPEGEGDGHVPRRSGSSNPSSSSEDDGQGGMRKKTGLKKKIKEKLPGCKHSEVEDNPEDQDTSGAACEEEQQHHEHHEKKSVMDKIKEKLPGHHSSLSH